MANSLTNLGAVRVEGLDAYLPESPISIQVAVWASRKAETGRGIGRLQTLSGTSDAEVVRGAE